MKILWLSGILRGTHNQIRRIDIIIEKAFDTVKNPEGMT